MRALCGAIITAGALMGLGLACVGIGLRYQNVTFPVDGNSDPRWLHFKNMDTPLVLAFVVLCIGVVVGLGISFLGLAYHHHRRHHELLRDPHRGAGERNPERITL